MKYTILIFVVCTFIFIYQNANPQLTENLVLSSKNIFGLFTYMFAHANMFHFLLNMLVLFAFGIVVEEIFSYKMLVIFMASGIIAGLFSLIFYESIIGASGAIYGLIGAAALLKPQRETWLGIIGIPMPLMMVAIIYVMFDIVGLFFYTGIANIAHLIGLLVGIAFAIKNKHLASPL